MTQVETRLPNFMIIGGMKCATSTLHDQLAQQPGFFMSTPKEPNYFSNDDVFANGESWYNQLFSDAGDAELVGESSTHYTKFPTYPQTLNRLEAHGLGQCKFIYVIRHPVDRLVSHYIHEWSQGVISSDIEKALQTNPELIDYSRYYFQLNHYLQRFDASQLMVVYFERLSSQSQQELERICQFLGYSGAPVWDDNMERKNVSAQRIRKFPFYDLVVESKLMTSLRRNLVPRQLRDAVKAKLTMNKRPELSAQTRAKLEAVFNEDLAQLGKLVGTELNCTNFKDVAKNGPAPDLV
ncbi:sulfotransferase family protein [Teredinibacter turnerae]|uniref:sulfotransferase family protein n=1 Tax=Teredinibacter turnerae TaxID=2426 RepID=UPI0005F8167F|nr:sulfotransferase [Teredinibacter turnerae]